MLLRRPSPLIATACAAFALTSACVTPPIISPAGRATLELSATQRALHAECVEVDVGNGEKLRGIFVPGRPNAPVVLHFLGQHMSITSGIEVAGLVYDIDPLLEQIAASGWGSLVLDYRGVGASDGVRDPKHLPDDALAAWSEALRRAGGDPSLVYVSGVSIGTLAAASLLERGVEPGFVALAAPVRAETMARNCVAEHYGSVPAGLVSPLLRKPVDIDLVAALKRPSCSLYVITATGDELLPLADRELVETAVRSSVTRDCWYVERDFEHLDLVLESWRVSKHGFWWPFELVCELIGTGADHRDERDAFLDDSRMCQVPPGRSFR